MAQQRFAFEWDRPSLPDAKTHVSLFDGSKDPLHVVASGHGAGDVNAIADLLTTLLRNEPALDAAAEKAVRQWIFVPTLVDGRPVSVLHTVSLSAR